MSEKSNKKWYNALGQWIVENSGSGAVMFPSQIDEKMKIQAAINQQKIFVPKELQKNNETLQKLEKQLAETPKWKDQDKTKPITPNIPLNVKKDSSSTMLRYPDQLQHQESDYMMFSFYDYVPPFSAEAGNREGEGVKGNGEVYSPYSQSKISQTNLNLGQYNSSVAKNASRADGYKQIVLYMPDDVQDALSATWEGKAFGTLAADTLTTAGAKGSLDAVRKLTNTLGNATSRLNVNATAKLITKLAAGITGDEITEGDVFAGVKGVVRNPNVEVLFEKMSLRTFDHSFKMSPYNAEDEMMIRRIISQFKKAMLPSYEGGDVFTKKGKKENLNGAFIKLPKLVQVAYMRGNSINPHLPQYKLCALTDVNVNYTPDNNYATFGSGGGPVSYELKLNFMETKLVFSEDIEAFDSVWGEDDISSGSGYGLMAG
tara:strand:- start:678 stop:1967 length:1290 start_codon:yes stop_codon:yes gene_type:complete